MPRNSNIRLANLEDVNSIVEIYNQGIINRNNAILDEIVPEDYADNFKNRNSAEYPIFVYVIENKVVGWISLSPYRANRRAYRRTKEVSFYIDSKHHSKGIGSQLLEFVIDEQGSLNFSSLFALLVANNDKSIALLKKYEFSLWGLWPQVLEIDDVRYDAIVYGRNFF